MANNRTSANQVTVSGLTGDTIQDKLNYLNTSAATTTYSITVNYGSSGYIETITIQ